LGVLLRNARQAANRDLEEAARYLSISPLTLEAYELGEESPSLPHLEALAEFYRVPLTHFWGETLLPSKGETLSERRVELIGEIRQRVIGVLLRKRRQELGLSLEQLAEQVGIEAAELERYEYGEKAIPLPVLEACALALQLKINVFMDRERNRSNAVVFDQQWQDFQSLPDELKSFVCKPINRPYIELAQRLSEMSVEKLRAVAEGLLEITL